MEWIPIDPEEKGETLVLTEADMLELGLVQHYGADYDDPDSFLIALGRRDADAEASADRMQGALKLADSMLALEEYAAVIKKGRSRRAEGSAKKQRNEKALRTKAICDWVDAYMANRSTPLSASDLAGKLLRFDFEWPAGVKLISEGAIRKVISAHLKAD